MTRLRLLVALSSVAWLVACGDGGATARPARPNVLLVVADTLRADHLSTYGYPWRTSPHLDALAGRGVVFTDCTAQASWTMPSMISLMTGQPVFNTLYRVPDEYPVLAERFAEAGWTTGAFVANSLVAAEAGFARGVDAWDARLRNTPKWDAADVERRALAFLDRVAAGGGPWFLWVHTMDTHTPYEPPSTPWRRAPSALFDEAEQALVREVLDGFEGAQRAALAAQIPELADVVDRYDGEVAVVDAFVGRMLDALEARGLRDDTYVVFVADHGETLFTRREITSRSEQMTAWKARNGQPLHLEDLLKKEHDGTVYEELVRTPFVLAGPGLPAGRREDALVANIDVGPTLLGLCGLPSTLGAGRDLSRALLADAPVPDAPWATTSCQQALAARLPDGRKLVLPLLDVEHGFDTTPRVYDLRADPDERAPRVLDGSAAPDAALAEVLERLRRAPATGPFAAFGGAEADAETLERLKELGYVR